MVLVILPRQARDNHRESTQRRSACLQLAVLHARGGRAPRCQHSQLFLRLRTGAVPGLHVLLEQIVGGLPLRYDTQTLVSAVQSHAVSHHVLVPSLSWQEIVSI